MTNRSARLLWAAMYLVVAAAAGWPSWAPRPANSSGGGS